MKRQNKLFPYLLCALFAALTAVCSQIMVPLPFTPVPINLALLAVWVCGGTLGARKGAIAILVYILLGAIGVPVFTGFAGGLGILAGPTGGYIIGYLPSVVVMGLMRRRDKADEVGAQGGDNIKKATMAIKNFAFTITRGLAAVIVCYSCGTIWFMVSTGTGFVAAMTMCVIPFIPGDILKLVAAGAVCEALARRFPLQNS